MDDQLKARLIGAVILVAVAVLLIPELLSGRKAEAPQGVADGAGRGTRTYTIDLTGTMPTKAMPDPKPDDKAPSVNTTLPTPAGPVPEPARSAVPEPAVEQRAVAAPGQPAPVAKATEAMPGQAAASPPSTPIATKPAKAAVKGGWSVQVGAFGSAVTAGRLVTDLKSAGYAAYVSPISKGGKTLHRVRVGPEAARGDADRLAARLKERHLPATVVAND